MHGCTVPTYLYAITAGLTLFAIWLLAIVVRDWQTRAPRFGRLCGAAVAALVALPLYLVIYVCRTWP